MKPMDPQGAETTPVQVSRTPHPLFAKWRRGVSEGATAEPDTSPGPSIAEVLDELDTEIGKRIVLGEFERTAVTLWIAHTYVFDRFKHTPRLFVTSADAAMGKSELLSLVAAFSNGGLKVDGITTSALKRIRSLGEGDHTICLDQLDTMNEYAEKDSELLNTLCSSTETAATGLMSERGEAGSGALWKPTPFKYGVPTALGKIKMLSGTPIMTRCILINMLPETPEQRAQQLPDRLKPLNQDQMRGKLRITLRSVKPVYTKAPEGIPSRTEDVWQPLLAVAAAAGEQWKAKALDAMFVLNEGFERPYPAEFALLRKAAEVTASDRWSYPYIFRGELRAKLGDPARTEKRQTQMLTAAGLKIKTVRRGKDVKKGYSIEDIREAAARLPPEL